MDKKSQFKAKLFRPAQTGSDPVWGFVVLPKDASDQLPRRGRTSIEGTINGHPFQATLDPDGQLSHWLRVSGELQESAGVKYGDQVSFEIAPVEKEPEPEIPPDFQQALAADSAALDTWKSTTTIARLDWIHWIVSAKQSKTRVKRVRDACAMLAEGKKRVCCFDQSGYYSKSLSAPQAVE